MYEDIYHQVRGDTQSSDSDAGSAHSDSPEQSSEEEK